VTKLSKERLDDSKVCFIPSDECSDIHSYMRKLNIHYWTTVRFFFIPSDECSIFACRNEYLSPVLRVKYVFVNVIVCIYI
jgi:hypothetical protein